MNRKEFHQVIEELRKTRILFHSEDDLKFAISFIIKHIFPDFQIRLEKPQNIEMINRIGEASNARAPIDIVIVKEKTNELIPIELKYKTKELDINYNNESYNLTNQGAKDIGRFSFRKDIYRVEKFIQTNENSRVGFVLIITNDPGYYSQDVTQKNVLDSNFSFHDGMIILKKDRSWNYKSINTKLYELDRKENKWKYKSKNKYHWSCIGEKFNLLDLQSEYKVKWLDYSTINNSVFKFCLVLVTDLNHCEEK